MQLHIRGASTHVLDVEPHVTVAEIKVIIFFSCSSTQSIFLGYVNLHSTNL